jgi:hypothetical protein
MNFETEKSNSRESVESRENKEGEVDKELQAAAAMERADVMIREVKSSKKQMQNIVRHMQEVQNAIRKLRTQLQLAQNDEDDASVKGDKKIVEDLKLKIKDYVGELESMRDDLVREQMEELKNGIGVGMSTGELQKKAEGLVDDMIKQVKE